MRLLGRTQREFVYRTIVGKEHKVDAEGYKTGEYDVIYGEPVTFIGNLGSITGDVERTLGGNFINYNGVILTKTDLPKGALVFNSIEDTIPSYTVSEVKHSTNYNMVGVMIWEK